MFWFSALLASLPLPAGLLTHIKFIFGTFAFFYYYYSPSPDIMVTMGFVRDEINDALINQKYDDVMATYILLGRKPPEVSCSPCFIGMNCFVGWGTCWQVYLFLGVARYKASNILIYYNSKLKRLSSQLISFLTQVFLEGTSRQGPGHGLGSPLPG